MTAWDTLITNSTAPNGSNAWEHLHSQQGGGIIFMDGFNVSVQDSSLSVVVTEPGITAVIDENPITANIDDSDITASIDVGSIVAPLDDGLTVDIG